MKCCNTLAKFDESRKEHSQIIKYGPIPDNQLNLILSKWFTLFNFTLKIFLFPVFVLIYIIHTHIHTRIWCIWCLVHFDLLLNYLDSIFSEHVFYEKNDVMFITLNDKPFSKLTNDQNGTFNATHDFTLRYFAHIKFPKIFTSICGNLLSTRD